jgi:hypothetical protein
MNGEKSKMRVPVPPFHVTHSASNGNKKKQKVTTTDWFSQRRSARMGAVFINRFGLVYCFYDSFSLFQQNHLIGVLADFIVFFFACAGGASPA